MTVPRGAIAPDRAAALQRARKIARMLDSAVAIPGTDFRIGLDPILGLLPGVGDIAGGALSAYIVLIAGRAGVPASVLLRMVVNVAVDTLIGGVPLLGDLFDAGWKSNMRNVSLLEQFIDRPRATRRSSAVLAIVMAVVALLLVVGIGAGIFVLGRALLASIR